MTALILATLALALAILGLIFAWKHYNDLTEYLDSLNVAQEEESARANRLYLDLEQAKERINEDLVHHNKRLKRHDIWQGHLQDRLNDHQNRVTKLEKDSLTERLKGPQP